MKSRKTICLCIIGLFAATVFSNCATVGNYDFSLRNTLAIFLQNDGNDYYFGIPIQYPSDYHVEGFKFDNGYIIIGNYEIILNRDDISIDTFEDEYTEEYDDVQNQYCIIIERILSNSEMKKIINEYKKGNTYCKFYVEFTITIDNEQMPGYGILDDFELYNGPEPSYLESVGLPSNLEFYRARVLQRMEK
jgi:hypothetical protein